ncbi:MAG: prephenate dehydratase [Elusimicrobiota bacterium]|nr:prephenate dehydratase [Elusimicrobiota bacterium]
MANINQERKKIDSIDKNIVKLLNERANIALTIGKEKIKTGEKIYSPSREKDVIKKASSGKTVLSYEDLTSIYTEIISACRNLQTTTKIAFLGPWATWTHQAALKKFGSSGLFIPCADVGSVIEEIENSRADFGIVPVENSNEGSVNVTLDLLVDVNLFVCGEISIKIDQSFLVKEPTNQILRIYSHPQGLAQCRKWLSKNYPDVELIPVASTAEAAKKVAKESFAAAIASEAAAKIYKLHVLESGIQDGKQNFTRFFVIGHDKTKPTKDDKTSLVFMIKDDRVGALHDILSVFDKNKINMTKIESRPSKKKVWEYMFFADIEGHFEDKKVANTVKELKDFCVFVKVLGSYPKA